MLIFNSWHTAGRADIYSVADDGSHLHCLTARYNLQRYQRLRLSPQHDLLLFYAFDPRQDAFRYFFWELGTDKLNVYEQEPYPYVMRWLTNDKLLCTLKHEHWVVDIENPARTDLDCFADYLMRDIAPDGNRVLLTQGPGVGGNIHVGDIEQRQIQEIFHAEYVDEQSPEILYPSSWSPDGKMIACVGGHEDAIWLIDADGARPRKFADSDIFWCGCQWSPDSQKISYTRGLDGGGPDAKLAGVFVRELEGGDERQVLQLGQGSLWRWTPDGQGIVYTQAGEAGAALLRVDVQTGLTTELIGPAAAIKDIAELIVVRQPAMPLNRDIYMSLNQAHLIVEKPAAAQARYLDFCRSQGWLDNLKRLSASLPFIDPTAYRGTSRNPLSAFPIGDVTELRRSNYHGVDVNTAAQLRMFELQQDDESDSSMLASMEQAAEVYKLLDVEQQPDYEIVRITQIPGLGEVDESAADILGYDIGYWGGDYFSIICDCAIRPMWHPPAWDDLPEVARQLKSLNLQQLFGQISQARAFRNYYTERPWAETESVAGEFCIIRVEAAQP